jgi:GDPmannose 4,6-dehydratase
MFNHESERRGPDFVTRKITMAAARIKNGTQKTLKLGNLEAVRDWGYSPDYVEAMWLMLQDKFPHDYVIGTGETHSVKEFLNAVFDRVGLSVDEFVSYDKTLIRPSEVDILRADSSLIKERTGWEPKTSFVDLVKRMVDHDLKFSQQK